MLCRYFSEIAVSHLRDPLISLSAVSSFSGQFPGRFCFFFSSRRRHTRSLCDWSSDVCSSDLIRRRNEPSAATRLGVPLRRRRRIGPGTAQTFLAFLAALVFLLALFTPVSESENHRPVLDYHPALEILLIAAALALLGLVGGRLPRPLRAFLAVTVLAAALLHLADALLPGLFGRTVDLYWDLGQIPSIFRLFYEAAGFSRAPLDRAAPCPLGREDRFVRLHAAPQPARLADLRRRLVAGARHDGERHQARPVSLPPAARKRSPEPAALHGNCRLSHRQRDARHQAAMAGRQVLGFRRALLRQRPRLPRPGIRLVRHPRPIHAEEIRDARDPRRWRRGRPAPALRSDRAGVGPHAVLSGAALSRGLGGCRRLCRGDAGGMGEDFSPAGLERSRAGLSRIDQLRSRCAWRFPGDAGRRRRSRHHPRRPPAAGLHQRRAATLDGPDLRALEGCGAA